MDLEGINLLDAALGGIVLISSLVGIARGLFREVLSLVAWVLSLWLAVKFAPHVSETWVRQLIEAPSIAYIASFGGVFFASLFVIGLINLLLTSLFDAVKMGGFNRLLGMVFGFLRGLVIGAVIVGFISGVFPNLKTTTAWTESKLRSGFENIAYWGIQQIPVEVRKNADTWLNSDPNKNNTLVPDNKDKADGAQISLTSLEENASTPANTPANTNPPSNATRPQIDANEQRRRSERNDAMSQGQTLQLESAQ